MIPVLLLLLAAPPGGADSRTPSGCSNLPIGGGFEGGTGGPWAESSSNGLKVLCTPGLCGTGGGTAGPRSGIWWAWMGGLSSAQEVADVSQTVTIPAGTAELSFFLWIGASSGNGQDRVRALLDTTSYVTILEGDPGHTGGYAEVFVDVSEKADGASHVLRIEATTEGGGVTNFSVDDVRLVSCPPPPPPPPVIDIDDPAAAVAEGDAGSTNATFTVSLSNASTELVTVAYATGPASSGVPATPGADYQPTNGTLSFAAGTQSMTVTVPVLGDTLDELAETFAVTLSNPSANATLGDAVGEATITDNDSPPALSVADLTAAEGDSGTTDALFAVSLSAASGLDVTVSFVTANGTAIAGVDYTAASGALTFPAGTTSTVVPVSIAGDVLDEGDETFSLGLSGPVNASLADAQGQATIDDDDGPGISIVDASVIEGDAGTANAVFSVRLSASSVQTVSVSYGASDGTAVDGLDYTAVSGTLTFAPGVTLHTFPVPALGDVVDEPDETFHVTLSGPQEASLTDAFGLGHILDDDGGAITLEGDLVHGSIRWEDLAALPGPSPDQDVYLLERPPHSSFEVVVDAVSGDLGAGSGPLLERLDAFMTTVVQDSVPIGAGSSRSLRMQNLQGLPVTDYVRVRSAGCGTDCDPADVYRIRAWETTGSIARFNNSGSQASVLVLGNTQPVAVSGSVWFHDATGAEIGSAAFSLVGKGTLVLNTTTVSGVAGQSGTITVSHDGPYGALVGKAVAVEASTGLAFDTPLLTRPR